MAALQWLCEGPIPTCHTFQISYSRTHLLILDATYEREYSYILSGQVSTLNLDNPNESLHSSLLCDKENLNQKKPSVTSCPSFRRCSPFKMGAVCSENEDDNIAVNTNVRRSANTVHAEPIKEEEKTSDEIIASFEEAAHHGQEDLVMHLDQRYPDLDLLDLKFKNGDSVLHTAIRNKNGKLLLYCLENGIKVKQRFHSEHLQILNQRRD